MDGNSIEKLEKMDALSSISDEKRMNNDGFVQEKGAIVLQGLRSRN